MSMQVDGGALEVDGMGPAFGQIECGGLRKTCKSQVRAWHLGIYEV